MNPRKKLEVWWINGEVWGKCEGQVFMGEGKAA